MKRIFKISGEIFWVVVIVAIFLPLWLFFNFPMLIKAYIRYVSDDDEFYTFSDHFTDVRHESKSFNKYWRRMASKGILVD